MRNRVLYTTLITRRRGKVSVSPGHMAGRFSGESRINTGKQPESGNNPAKTE
jgi:hypothetical protein